MREFVGVTRLQHILFSKAKDDPLKREALLFNRVAISDLDLVFQYYDEFRAEWKLLCRDIEWLFEKGVIVSFREMLHDNRDAWAEASEVINFLAYGHPTVPGEEAEEPTTYHGKMKDIRVGRTLATGANSVAISASLSLWCNVDAVPIVDNWSRDSQPSKSTKGEVIEVLLERIPTPDEKTSWEQILEFRSDPDSYSKFLALRNWMSEVARMKLEPNEVGAKLEYLMNDYENHMRIHKIKTRLDTLKTIVIAEAGFITGGWLAGLGFVPGIVGMVATPIYSIKQREVSLMEEEQRAPGKEVAYIIKSGEKFAR